MQVQDAGLTRVLESAVHACRHDVPATLAVVLETEGSTYARSGTAVLFSNEIHVGWLSGGCLEPVIDRQATRAWTMQRMGWMEIDTRDDAALFSASAVGCRGRQRVVLLPLAALPGVDAVFDAWLQGAGPLQLALDAGGGVQLSCGERHSGHQLHADALPWPGRQTFWSLRWPPPPRAVLLGGGPETGPLVPTLTGLGWQLRVIDPRPAWRSRCVVDVEDTGMAVVLAGGPPRLDAALVMHHNFELDLQALQLLAASSIPFIGLLGPKRRREDLFALLPAATRKALAGRLRSPIGLDLGGRGPDAIALSIAAELQAWLHRTSLQRQ